MRHSAPTQPANGSGDACYPATNAAAAALAKGRASAPRFFGGENSFATAVRETLTCALMRQ